MLVTVMGFALLLATLAVVYRTYIASEKFSPTIWRMLAEGSREAMARDFVANHFRSGMSRDEVIALLGEPSTGFPQELQYVVGSAFIDYVVLWVVIDEHGNAVRAFIYTTS